MSKVSGREIEQGPPLIVSLTVAFGAIGCAGIIWIYISGASLPAWWSKIGTAPEKVTRVLTITILETERQIVEIYLKTATGKILLYDKRTNQWTIVSALPQPTGDDINWFYHNVPPYDTQRFPEFASLPGRVKDATYKAWSIEGIGDSTNLVILEDNSLWEWRDNQRNAYVLFCFVLGLIYLTTLFVVIKRRRANNVA